MPTLKQTVTTNAATLSTIGTGLDAWVTQGAALFDQLRVAHEAIQTALSVPSSGASGDTGPEAWVRDALRMALRTHAYVDMLGYQFQKAGIPEIRHTSDAMGVNMTCTRVGTENAAKLTAAVARLP